MAGAMSALRLVHTPSCASSPARSWCRTASIRCFYGSIDRYAANIGSKGIPLSELMAYLLFFTESVGAICLAIGLFTRIAAAMIGIQMLVIAFVFQWHTVTSGPAAVTSSH